MLYYNFITMWYSKKEMISYLFAFLHSKQQITTKTNKNKHAEDIDQKATWIGESGSHQNWKWNILVITNQYPNQRVILTKCRVILNVDYESTYFCSRRICWCNIANNCWKVFRPKSTFPLTVIPQSCWIFSCINS